jgi:tetratricopeptide (TPR) repeat protein
MPSVEEAEQALASADEAFGRFDVDGVVAHLSAAIRGFTAVDDRRRAAMTCVRLGSTLANAMGNLTASRAWFARARRLVEHEPPCVEQGWVAIAAVGCDVDDPAELLAAAELALDRARRFGDVDLETKALADAGLAHVQAGRVTHGMALLDEAMALACGPAEDADATGMSVCSFFTACYYAADFGRAGSWSDLLRRHGLVGPGRGTPIFLSSHCDSVQAALLVELGRWGEAETVLTKAIAEFEAAMPFRSWHPEIALADLRIRQGRCAEAEELLLGKEQAVQALLPTARLHLARGDHELARATARRGLRAMGADRLRAIDLLTVLVDAELAREEPDAAVAACADLTDRLGDLDVGVLQARAAGAQARVLAATGRVDDAVAVLEAAVDRLDAGQIPWLLTTLLLELARMRLLLGDDSGAAVDTRAAVALLATLDVVLTADDVALLAALGHGSPGRPVAPAARTATLARDGRSWLATCDGRSVRLHGTKGLRYLAELLARPGTEHHALDLVDRVEGIAPEGGPARRALGDAGAVLDTHARAAYRHRIEHLRAEADDDLAAGHLEAAEAHQVELDALVAQLAQAFGLGGRERRAASAAERARLNVTRALRTAISHLVHALPEAGAALDRRVHTGLYCTYAPASDDGVRWIVQPGVNEGAAR